MLPFIGCNPFSVDISMLEHYCTNSAVRQANTALQVHRSKEEARQPGETWQTQQCLSSSQAANSPSDERGFSSLGKKTLVGKPTSKCTRV